MLQSDLLKLGSYFAFKTQIKFHSLVDTIPFGLLSSLTESNIHQRGSGEVGKIFMAL